MTVRYALLDREVGKARVPCARARHRRKNPHLWGLSRSRRSNSHRLQSSSVSGGVLKRTPPGLWTRAVRFTSRSSGQMQL